MPPAAPSEMQIVLRFERLGQDGDEALSLTDFSRARSRALVDVLTF